MDIFPLHYTPKHFYDSSIFLAEEKYLVTYYFDLSPGTYQYILFFVC